MAEFHGACSADDTVMTWYWTGVPTDDRAPGLDSYFVEVIDTVTKEPVVWVPGAEDNLNGEPYSVDVVPGRDYYVRAVNDAAGFHFETDTVVSCGWEDPAPTPEALEPLSVFPFLVAAIVGWRLR